MSAIKNFLEQVSEAMGLGGEITDDVAMVGQYLLVRGIRPQAASADLLDCVKDLNDEEINNPGFGIPVEEDDVRLIAKVELTAHQGCLLQVCRVLEVTGDHAYVQCLEGTIWIPIAFLIPTLATYPDPANDKMYDERLQTLLNDMGGELILRRLGKILMEEGGIGNGFAVGKALIALSEVEW